MKVILLAAGYGTRLAPITNRIPKCLIPINGYPLIDYWIKWFEKYKIEEVLINTHYLSEDVAKYLKTHPTKIKFNILYEPELLGSGGTVLTQKYNIDETCLICNADNLTNFNLYKLLKFHKENPSILTVGLFNSDNPTACGIVELNSFNEIINFEEKPLIPKSNLANAGIYLIEPEIFNYISDNSVDFASDIIPKVPSKYGILLDGYLKDIGTIKDYKQAREDVINGIYK